MNASIDNNNGSHQTNTEHLAQLSCVENLIRLPQTLNNNNRMCSADN